MFFENTPLPYPYAALEPHIDAETMKLHHDRHLQTYIDSLNDALLCAPGFQGRTAAQLSLLQNRPSISKNAGGVFNHRFYFAGMTPDADRHTPEGTLKQAVLHHFCTKENFIHAFTASALQLYGSGYTWLACNRQKQLIILTTPNQEVPMLRGLRPLLCCDMWEHAYYLKNQNRRAAYLESWFRVLDWQRANALFTGEVPFFDPKMPSDTEK
ncbi:MAG: superoxide dismutase [Clostridia bacterium]|nr:superoxide dismutase [Clostridia bacterium]